MKKVVRIGTLVLDTACHKNVDGNKPVDGKVTDAGKALRKTIKDYFNTNFSLDVVTKFTPTATEDGSPGFMIMARNTEDAETTLFSTDVVINHKRKNFITITSDKSGKATMVKLKEMDTIVANALREYRDKARNK